MIGWDWPQYVLFLFYAIVYIEAFIRNVVEEKDPELRFAGGLGVLLGCLLVQICLFYGGFW